MLSVDVLRRRERPRRERQKAVVPASAFVPFAGEFMCEHYMASVDVRTAGINPMSGVVCGLEEPAGYGADSPPLNVNVASSWQCQVSGGPRHSDLVCKCGPKPTHGILPP